MVRQITLVAAVVVIAAFFTIPSTNAIVCTPSICDNVKCANDISPESCAENGQEYKANGGFCGCCPVCVTIIKSGHPCLTPNIKGVPLTAFCEEGTECHNNICVPTAYYSAESEE